MDDKLLIRAYNVGVGDCIYVRIPKARKKGSKVDDFHIHDREAYWLSRIRSSDSTFSGAMLEKALGMPATMRNITTVRKLAAKYPAPQ